MVRTYTATTTTTKSAVGKVKDVHPLAAAMKGATDALNTALVQAEKAFFALDLGVSATVSISDGEPSDWEESLSFTKIGGHWGLYVTRERHDGSDWSSSAILSASREQRVQAATKIPELHQALLAEAREQAESMLQESQRLFDFVKNLKAGGGA